MPIQLNPHVFLESYFLQILPNLQLYLFLVFCKLFLTCNYIFFLFLANHVLIYEPSLQQWAISYGFVYQGTEVTLREFYFMRTRIVADQVIFPSFSYFGILTHFFC